MIVRGVLGLLALAALSACTTVPAAPRPSANAEIIQILAINDFHGNLEVPASDTTYIAEGTEKQERLGGAARLGATLAHLRQGQPHTVTVAAGDLIGASPFVSAYFLDEPTILALNALGLDLAAVGNHEFDKGVDELRRMQRGGCEAHTKRVPCQLDNPFGGATFAYLAANVLDESGQPLFPGTSLRAFGPVKLGFIGMTLRETGTLTSPGGTKGFRFADEADTANRLAAELKAQGADAVVLVIHQGGEVDPWFNADSCPGLDGDVLPILARLTPDIRLVVSGHTHKAYVCEVPDAAGNDRLLTSAGRYGYFVTEIHLTVDPNDDRVVSLSAVNRPVVAAAGEQAEVAGLVSRYAAASASASSRVVGRVTGELEGDGALDSPLARMVADAQLAATRDPAGGGAQVAFINSGGVRAGFGRAEDGSVTFGQLFALQPFGNTLEVLELTGAQLKATLESQFGADGAPKPSILVPSQGFAYAFDRTAPAGQRLVSMTLDGRQIDPAARYRVTVNNFLATGGDGFAPLVAGRFIAGGSVDIDALEAFIARGVMLDATARVTELGPP